MTSALRWAAMRVILAFHNCEEQSHKTVSTEHNFWRERRAEADSNALPLGQTGSQLCRRDCCIHLFHTCVSYRYCMPLLDHAPLSRGNCYVILFLYASLYETAVTYCFCTHLLHTTVLYCSCMPLLHNAQISIGDCCFMMFLYQSLPHCCFILFLYTKLLCHILICHCYIALPSP